MTPATWVWIALSALVLSGCSLPPIAKGADDAEFRARVMALYPVGSQASRMRSDLEKQGFKIERYPGEDYSAIYQGYGNLFCDSLVRVNWREDAEGKITQIIPFIRGICL
jgi:hypothetical protein